MKLPTFLALFLALAIGALAAFGSDANPPAASTNPSTFAIHGRVKISANLDFQTSDLPRVVIYLGSDPGLDAAAISTDRPTVAQLNKAFVPNFLAVAKGTEVEFPNWDHFSHNVFSRSAVAPFDLDRYPYGESKSRKFDSTGVVQIFCNIHPYMKAIIFVAPNKYFTHADDAGTFTLPDVPAGHYDLFAWQERCGKQHQSVDVGLGIRPDITFTLSEDRESILANDPPRHADGYGIDRGLGVKRERLNLPVVEDSHPAPTSEPCPNCQ